MEIAHNKISVVVPCYRCAGALIELHTRLVPALKQLTQAYEIIFVNDASPQEDWKIIRELAAKDSSVTGINLSRNFGQHCAITAGLEHCTGDWVVVMDGDLQDVPEEINKMYRTALEGYDVVVGKRQDRKDSWLVQATSSLFYMVFNYLTDQKLDNKVANFGIYSRKVISNVKRFKEGERSFGLLVVLAGFPRAEIDVSHAPRAAGQSAYSFRSRFKMAGDLILSHSNKPLILAIQGGFIISFLSLSYGFWLGLRYFFTSNIPDGWTSLMVSLFFLSGVIVVVVGMVGLYVGKIYNEIKGRPLYIIQDTVSGNNTNLL